MKNLVKWSRSKDGRVESKCGKYSIVPCFNINKTVQGYECWWSRGYLCTFKTQAECKDLFSVLEYFSDEKTRIKRMAIVESFIHFSLI